MSDNELRAAPAKSLRKGRSKELTPLQRALALLVRREHSRIELARKLSARGVETQAAAAAVERLSGEGWQSDARFAEMLVRTRVAQGYGPVRIRAELGTHGMDRDGVDAAIVSFEGDWSQRAQELVKRRFGEAIAANPAQRRKAADFLYRRGFDGDVVRSAMRTSPKD